MERLLIAVAVVAIAAIVGEVVRRRRAIDPPTQPKFEAPAQLDRADFDGDGWLVAVFTSETCSTCADVVNKAEVVRSDEVAVEVVPFQSRKALHERYSIDAVPCLVIADADGVVHRAFLGPVTATDLWAAIANAREPGSIDQSDGCGNHD
ncbi:MAG: hypothetical protein RIB65_19920 [Ilumatobacter fluminis]|uniref:hypothetical protein n=1 Tax=Ilumatobacter fluminis TaxID=467091 RepID=UPI0032EE77CF